MMISFKTFNLHPGFNYVRQTFKEKKTYFLVAITIGFGQTKKVEESFDYFF